MRRKNEQEQPAPESGGARITPVDIQQAEFRLAFRGYNERDVDAFLDRITEDLSSYLEENQRLQATPGVVRVTDEGATDAGDIVAQAREEAAAIIRVAEEEAAALRASAGQEGGDARSAVGPFLNKEREFLQGLGSLVQSHAEEIKGMVAAIRARSEAPQAAATGPDVRLDARDEPETATAHESAAEAPSASFDAASSSEIRTRMGFEPDTVTVSEGAATEDEEDAVVVESATEPVYTTEGPNDRRERSLRELFWGED